MPGGRQNKGAGPDVYTALMFVGVVAMGVAVAMLWIAGTKIRRSNSSREFSAVGIGISFVRVLLELQKIYLQVMKQHISMLTSLDNLSR